MTPEQLIAAQKVVQTVHASDALLDYLQALIAANHGPSFGKGGASFLRFNLATPRSVVAESVDRLKQAFVDLQ